MTQEEEWQRWRERYDKTHNGVLRLFHDRAIWRTILAMLDANPAVARGGFGEYWLGSCYTTSQLIGIRRETGADNQSIGMLRSLNSLASTPRMATRAWHQQEIAEHGHPEEDRDRLFNRFAGPTQPFIDSGLVQKDIAVLEAVIDRVNSYTNKALAHRDDSVRSGPPPPVITWAHLDDAIDTVGRIHKKYFSLCHPGETLGILTPLISPGWIQIFGTAWMPPGFAMPGALSFEPR
jgi:hypothetical protein